jgi:glutaredoxin
MQNQVDQILRRKDVVVFSKTYCPHSQRVKDLFKRLGIKPEVIELDTHPRGAEIHQEVIRRTNHRTVPSVWLQRNFIGGATQTFEQEAKGLFKSL